MRPRRGPVRRKGGGYVVDLGAEESTLVLSLLRELRGLLTEPAGEAGELLVRLFPTAYADDDEREAEYQRLMRDELVQSKLSAIEVVEAALSGDGRVDEPQLVAFMQAVNSVRLVLGTMLGVNDDPALDEVTPGMEDTPEYHLYGYLSWLLEHTVRTLS